MFEIRTQKNRDFIGMDWIGAKPSYSWTITGARSWYQGPPQKTRLRSLVRSKPITKKRSWRSWIRNFPWRVQARVKVLCKSRTEQRLGVRGFASRNNYELLRLELALFDGLERWEISRITSLAKAREVTKLAVTSSIDMMLEKNKRKQLEKDGEDWRRRKANAIVQGRRMEKKDSGA